MKCTGAATSAPGHRKPGRTLARFLAGAGAWAAVITSSPASAGAGDPEAGRLLFADKDCARCHLPRGVPGGGPSLDDLRRPQGEMELAGRLWNHVPDMFAAVALEAARWPRINAREMADLMAYLGADPARDREPDLYRGQVTLLRKDCLKCHSLRGEGGRVEPDLAQRRADYESGAAWAAAMWTHSPAMAAMAARRGIPYPRFSGDEMGNLLGFLRRAATPAPARPTTPGPGR